MTVLKKTGAVVVAVLPVPLLARLGSPAFEVVAALAAALIVPVVGLACWVIGDEQRSMRAVMLLTAARSGRKHTGDRPAISR